MAHPVTTHQFSGGYTGLAGVKFIASHKFRVEFHGRAAHAGGEPWNGVNALDAAVAAYNNVSMLRQQMRPNERVHGVIEDGGTVPNVITAYARMNWYVRGPLMKPADALLEKIHKCCEAAAASTGCGLNYITAPSYKNLRVNEPLCRQYVDDMAMLREKILLKDEESYTASTDMGNVSYEVPSFHSVFPIPMDPGVSMHHPRFAGHAATEEAHRAAIKCGKGMAMLTLRVLTNPQLVKEARKEFENLFEE